MLARPRVRCHLRLALLRYVPHLSALHAEQLNDKAQTSHKYEIPCTTWLSAAGDAPGLKSGRWADRWWTSGSKIAPQSDPCVASSMRLFGSQYLFRCCMSSPG